MWLRYFDKLIKKSCLMVAFRFSWLITYMKFLMNGVRFDADFISRGVPIINVNLKGYFSVGKQFFMHSGKYFNMIGRQQRCYFIVGKNAELQIGNNVGISSTAIVCQNKITIADNVRIGGGVVIYDTDFHSLNHQHRTAVPENLTTINTSPVYIMEYAFIGAHSIILKGVTIGKRSIIGAGSVVTKSVPDNEIWAGNPAKFIKSIHA